MSELGIRLLLERGQRGAGIMVRDGSARWVEVDYAVFDGAEAAVAAARDGQSNGKVSASRVGTDAGGTERVSALGAGGEQAVDQAGAILVGRSSAIGAAERGQRGRKADGRIIVDVGDHRGVDGPQRGHGGGFIGGDTRLQQVR